MPHDQLAVRWFGSEQLTADWPGCAAAQGRGKGEDVNVPHDHFVVRWFGSVKRAVVWRGSAAASGCLALPAARARSAAWLDRSAPETYNTRSVS